MFYYMKYFESVVRVFLVRSAKGVLKFSGIYYKTNLKQ